MAGIDLMTKPFRLAFPVLVEPELPPGGSKKKYSVTMLFDKDDTDAIMEVRKAIHEAAVAEWGPDKSKWPPAFRGINFKDYVSPNGKDGFPIRDGDTVPWDGFAGCWFVKASTNGEGPRAKRPILVDAKRKPILDPGEVEGGLICRARTMVSAYDANGNRGITLYLGAVQVVKDDGVRFGGTLTEDSAFDDWEDADSGTTTDSDDF